ncbi:MAG: hypothetical protein N3A58_06800 [Spirochaetes bacterium]|nr:hypothetical protein [Spirochaetota bacterium]
MEKRFMIIIIDKRKNNAIKVQEILTGWGCLIKIRLGIHDEVLDKCSDNGTIFLELVGEKEKHLELERKLNLLEGVKAKLIEINL